MKRVVKHGVAELSRVKAAIDAAYNANASRLSALGPKIVWNSPHTAVITISVLAKTIAVNLAITGEDVVMESKVPFLFSHLEGPVMDKVGVHLESWLAKARAGEV